MTQHEELVELTIASGVPPLALRYSAIRDCSSKYPIAYRTSTMVNSIVLGRLTHKEYGFATDKTETGVRLAEWNMREAIRDLSRFEAAGRNLSYISVRCPALLATKEDLYDRVKSAVEREHLEDPGKLCLEFPQSLLFEESPQVRKSILDMKLLGVRTLMSGCAANDCPMAKLSEIPVDAVLLYPPVTQLTNDRNKPQVVPTLVQYLKSMRLEVLAEGVLDDEQLRSLSRMECAGYIPDANYVGTGTYSSPVMPIEEAILQKEDG